MTARASGAAAVPPWSLAVAAMGSVQLGLALSVHLISTAGQLAGILLVILAGSAAQPGGRRRPPAAEHADARPSSTSSASPRSVTARMSG